MIMKDRHLTVRENADKIVNSIDSVHAILWNRAPGVCQICSQASVGGTELRLAVVQVLQDTTNAELDFLRLIADPKMKMLLKGPHVLSREGGTRCWS
ncbi:hypothetical protein TNCV_3873041 [Trichonephila clavipes]|nr:hypothetical protein TNCV_3873041 [Trichonephila clavipes]